MPADTPLNAEALGRAREIYDSFPSIGSAQSQINKIAAGLVAFRKAALPAGDGEFARGVEAARDAFINECARLFDHYQSQTAADAGRRQIIEHLIGFSTGEALRALSPAPDTVSVPSHPGISDEVAGRLFATTVSGGGQKPHVKIECQSMDDLHAVYSNLDRLRSGHALLASPLQAPGDDLGDRADALGSAVPTQPFERYPALVEHIQRMASTGNTGSMEDWCGFLDALNDALAPPEIEARQ
jgi:hypothetical protein